MCAQLTDTSSDARVLNLLGMSIPIGVTSKKWILIYCHSTLTYMHEVFLLLLLLLIEEIMEFPFQSWDILLIVGSQNKRNYKMLLL